MDNLGGRYLFLLSLPQSGKADHHVNEKASEICPHSGYE